MSVANPGMRLCRRLGRVVLEGSDRLADRRAAQPLEGVSPLRADRSLLLEEPIDVRVVEFSCFADREDLLDLDRDWIAAATSKM
jgi:hypothetical protein